MARLVETAAPLVPARPTLTSLRAAAAGCKACPLWQTGTQTVKHFKWTARSTRRIHQRPSSILRGEPSEREAAFAALVDDLRVAAALL
jgi:hypothetical protein